MPGGGEADAGDDDDDGDNDDGDDNDNDNGNDDDARGWRARQDPRAPWAPLDQLAGRGRLAAGAARGTGGSCPQVGGGGDDYEYYDARRGVCQDHY